MVPVKEFFYKILHCLVVLVLSVRFSTACLSILWLWVPRVSPRTFRKVQFLLHVFLVYLYPTFFRKKSRRSGWRTRNLLTTRYQNPVLASWIRSADLGCVFFEQHAFNVVQKLQALKTVESFSVANCRWLWFLMLVTRKGCCYCGGPPVPVIQHF